MDRLLERDLVVKALSLLLAVIIWFQVSAQQNVVQDRSLDAVPVRVVGLEANLMVTAPPQPWQAKVEVQGTRRALDRLRRGEVWAEVDMTGYSAGVAAVPVSVRVPPGVKVLGTFPDRLPLTVEQVVSKNLTVQTHIVEQAPESVRVEGITLSQTMAEVLGPHSLVSRVNSLVVRVAMAQVSQPVEMDLPVVALDRDGNEIVGSGLKIEPSAVSVAVAAKKLQPGTRVLVQPQVTGTPAAGHSVTGVTAQPAYVTVRGPEEAHSTWGHAETEPVAVTDRAESFAVPVQLRLPRGADSVEPAVVTVTVRIAEEEDEVILEGVPVQVAGVAAGLQASTALQGVQVRLRGPKAAIAGAGTADVRVEADAAGMGAGEHQLPLRVVVPPGLRGTVVDVRSVLVTLTGEE